MKRNAYLLAVLSLFVMWLWVPDATAQNKRYYVQKGAPVANTAVGATSWTTACDSLQAVINVAVAGDTVFVTVGTYEGGFFMKEGVQVYGGFKGDGTEMEYTDRTYPVDIANPSQCSILDGDGSMRVLTQLTPFTTETVWDGFVIRNGSAAGEKGQIVFNTAGTAPAGIIYRWDATTHSGYMVGLEQESKEWGGYGTDIPDLPNISTPNNTKKDFLGSGKTGLIVKAFTAGNYAAYWCATLSSGGFSDWYLPAGGEVYELYNQQDSVRRAIFQIERVTSALPALATYYWSSTENGKQGAWFVNFDDGYVGIHGKYDTRLVRAVRALNLFTHLDNLTFSGGGALLQEKGVLRRCVVTGNKAPGMGGGIFTRGGSVEGCLVTGNHSGRGSGVYAATGSVVTSSTIADNNQDTINIAPHPAPPAVGDYYYTDGSYSTSTGAANPLLNRELAGIVCYTNPSNPYAGFIMDTAQVKKSWTDAVEWARDSVRTGGYTDWQLPSLDMLKDGIYAGRSDIDDALSKIGATRLSTDEYWSGEKSGTNAYYVNFSNGAEGNDNMGNSRNARAVRAFNLYSNINKLENAGVVNAGGTEVNNSILWENKEQGGSIADYYGNSGDVSYSCAGTGVTAGSNGNKNTDPDFVGSGNYHLTRTSALIGAGNTLIVPTNLPIDLDNQERIIFGRTDMGAFQSQWIPVTIPNPLHVNGYSGPSETVFCDMETYDLSLTAAGDIYDYTWYRDGQQIDTTTDSICTITETGTYTVDVNGVLDTVSSGPVMVRFSHSPVIIKDIRDTPIIGGSVTLTVEATGPGLEYQWYSNNQPIPGAVTESLNTREEGTYYVLIKNECDEVESSTARVSVQIQDPTSNRRVDLPHVAGIVTTPSAGTHYVESRKDFVFYMSFADGYTLDDVTVSTNRGNEVLMEPTDDGRIKVTIKRVTTVITIRIEGDSNSFRKRIFKLSPPSSPSVSKVSVMG